MDNRDRRLCCKYTSQLGEQVYRPYTEVGTFRRLGDWNSRRHDFRALANQRRSPLVDVLIYASVCISLFVCYGRILSISWRQRRRVEPVNSVPRWPGRKTTSLSIATASSRVAAGDGTESPNDKPPTSTGASPEPAVTSGAASASELAREQQRQKIKSQRTCSFCVAAGKCFRAFRAERRS